MEAFIQWVKAKKEQAKDKGFLVKAGVGCLVALALVLLVFQVMLYRSRKAQLTISKQITKEQQRAADIAQQDSALRSEQDLLENKADAAMDRVSHVEAKIRKVEAAAEANKAVIRSLKSWKDVDDHVR